MAVLFLIAAGAQPVVAGDEAAERATVRKTKEQLHFELPPDWPIEKRGGIVGPIPVEEYLAQKFKTLDARLNALEQRLSGLDIRLRVLEEALKEGAQELKSSGSQTR